MKTKQAISPTAMNQRIAKLERQMRQIVSVVEELEDAEPLTASESEALEQARRDQEEGRTFTLEDVAD